MDLRFFSRAVPVFYKIFGIRLGSQLQDQLVFGRDRNGLLPALRKKAGKRTEKNEYAGKKLQCFWF